jgi:hypothetical protein
MKHNHPPILRLVVAVLLLGLAIGGGPVMFVLLVMASPSILILLLLGRMLFHGSDSAAPRQTPMQR